MKKIKGSTVIESVIAMVIISITLGAGTLIFVNVLKNDKCRLTLKASLLLKNISFQERNLRNYIDGEDFIDGFLIKKTFIKYPGADNLLQMKLCAFEEEKQIMEQNELVIIR